MNLEMIRNIVLIIGWPVLIAGSIYLVVKGRAVYKMVRGSMIGRITKALVVTMLVEMYSLGIVCTFYMFSYIDGVYIVLPIFAAWFIVFIWSMKSLLAAQKEAAGLSGGNTAS